MSLINNLTTEICNVKIVETKVTGYGERYCVEYEILKDGFYVIERKFKSTRYLHGGAFGGLYLKSGIGRPITSLDFTYPYSIGVINNKTLAFVFRKNIHAMECNIPPETVVRCIKVDPVSLADYLIAFDESTINKYITIASLYGKSVPSSVFRPNMIRVKTYLFTANEDFGVTDGTEIIPLEEPIQGDLIL